MMIGTQRRFEYIGCYPAGTKIDPFTNLNNHMIKEEKIPKLGCIKA